MKTNNKDSNQLSDLYDSRTINLLDSEIREAGIITEKDKLLAGKQILLGLAILFGLTVFAYMVEPEQGAVLLEICKTVFPPLATLIIAFYFKEKSK